MDASNPRHQPPGRWPRQAVWFAVAAGTLIVVLVAVVSVLVTRSNLSNPGPDGRTDGVQAQRDGASPLLLADAYTGTSVNRTAEQMGVDGRGSLSMQFTSKDPASLRGRIQVSGRYVGGTGIFEGRLEGNAIELDVSPTDGTPQYRLVGTIATDGTMRGALVVPGSANTYTQSGEWSVTPSR